MKAEKMVDVAKKMMARRNQLLSDPKQVLISRLYANKDNHIG